MSKEYYPVMGIETYTSLEPYDHLRDNNRVHTTGQMFHSYVAPETMAEIQEVGLANTDRVVFHETADKPLPEALKRGEMCLNDLWSVIVPGEGFKG